MSPASQTARTAETTEPSTTRDGPAGTAGRLAEVLAEVVGVEHVSPDSHFFDDLGADSMVMARFCARVRKRDDLPSVSMKDIYGHSTIASLTAALVDEEPEPIEPAVPAPVEVAEPVGTVQYLFCGAVQLLTFLAYTYLAAFVIAHGYEWISEGTTLLEVYLRSLLFGTAGFLGMCCLPILAKWLLVGRWKRQQFRIWSPAYVRFWIAKTLIKANPVALFAGSPLYVLYLRALGARIGKGVTILTRHVPVCTDMLTIGAGTVVRKDAYLLGYRAHGGLIQTGPVALGDDVFVGEEAVLDIDTSMGDHAHLDRASSLHPGQDVPAGERWHGSPARPTDVVSPEVEPVACGTLRRFVYSVTQLVSLLALFLPLFVGGVVMLLLEVPQLRTLLEPGSLAFANWTFYADALAVSFILFFGALVFGLLFVFTVPRLINLVLRPDRTYRLYGFHYWAQRVVTRMTNVKPFNELFGDSSYIVHYLRALGYDLSHVEQTGSNFGSAIKHDNPYLSAVGQGTMVADGLSVVNTEYSSTSFRLSSTRIGPHNFLGNHIVYPPQGRTGDNCLLATKVLVPVDGPVRTGTGLLGSPSMLIPRTVQRDNTFQHLEAGEEFARRLKAKNKHNIVSMALRLLVRWFNFFLVVLFASAAAELYHWLGSGALALATTLILVFSTAYYVVVERVLVACLPLRPMFCSIYDRRFWRHERFWKVPETNHLPFFDGTPFKVLIWRLMGVRIGKRVFDDGCFLAERTLVSIGDDCALNAGSKIQCHSQEDGTFKMDRIALGTGCTVGVNTLVHYGATMGDGSVIGADSFLMKGEEVPHHQRWAGNPATEVRSDQPVPVQRGA
ncbi:non-ribosomal peptide synthetase-like protein [Saccharopolyspora erythraea NRRL 2338]|uniref:Non-ribosomal peptide synthetase n=2 Tax=Saccharopolyspora erythraea TaxID=1836 RepID=A4FE17_SACEN|nr:Pls/PosA family non-ribosomal peptide synthetase [Saccharopolyspora erythraea]EQD82803.1 peptide synthetase [Saccharopolyspora erythraea D]PFG96019.1 non-ribosomal peptide synthetase-like protein [Saccharopolyspora erythraea NRRL 2338]QRK92575.1 peptide synthetase [Saccharopolyspora erythraea]CAM02292.1 non-ribosomal peptide synthetase [Saccharopolyspora erythraea NRRL 2338]